MINNQYRDLTLLEITSDIMLAIACDSSASIGRKEHDEVQINPEVVAACCLRVPLFELLCVGAEPISIIDVIGNEYEPTGRRMIAGIKSEMKKAGLSQLPLNGSTEENMTTTMSSLGITVTGQFEDKFIKPTIKSMDYLFQLGSPYVGNEVIENLSTLCDYQDLYELRQESSVVDLLPVGSKGIEYEGRLMAEENGLVIDFYEPENLELKKSAGPSTVVLVAVLSEFKEEFIKKHPQLIELGQFKNK